MNRISKRIDVSELNGESLDAVIAKLVEVRQKLSVDAASVEFRASGNYEDGLELIIEYTVPETAQDRQARESALLRRRQAQEQSEREQLARLKAKYG